MANVSYATDWARGWPHPQPIGSDHVEGQPSQIFNDQLTNNFTFALPTGVCHLFDQLFNGLLFEIVKQPNALRSEHMAGQPS